MGESLPGQQLELNLPIYDFRLFLIILMPIPNPKFLPSLQGSFRAYVKVQAAYYQIPGSRRQRTRD
jgi:hypothetical protein